MPEYQELRNMILQKATKYYNFHKKCTENWEHGGIAKIWLDANGNICIEYESGKWWHYNELGEWW